MRLVPVLCLVSSLSLSLAARQDHHGSSDQRGAMVMGFDQALTTHHFVLFHDGGAIEVSVQMQDHDEQRESQRDGANHVDPSRCAAGV